MPSRPHIIVIMTDQHRADTLDVYGDRQCNTPNLDRLAAEAVVFERHYTSCPLCAPARISIATGLYPHRSGAIINWWIPEEAQYGTLSPSYKTVYEHLCEAGYNVAQIGVQHVNTDPPLPQRCPNGVFLNKQTYLDYLQAKGLREPDLREYRAPCPDFVDGEMIWQWYTGPKAGRWPLPAEHFYDKFLARQMVEYIDAADPNEPLALFCMFWAPHCPLVVPEPYYGMYDAEQIDLPENVGKVYDGRPAMRLVSLPGFMGATADEQTWRRAWAAYLGLVTLVDECIGEVVEALKRRGFWDDALVVFTADHGEMLGSHRMFQKMCMLEESIRVPMFVKPPKTPADLAGRRVAGLTSHVDLTNTILDYAGLDLLSGTDSLSLRGLIEGGAASIRDEVFSEFSGNAGRGCFQRAIITERYKFVYNRLTMTSRPEVELYDRQKDPLETQNLVGDPAFRQVRDGLADRLARWMQSTGDFLKFEMPTRQHAGGSGRWLIGPTS